MPQQSAYEVFNGNPPSPDYEPQKPDIVAYLEALLQRIANLEAAAVEQGKRGRLLGEVFAIWDHIEGVSAPSNSGDAKYIKLTVGESGTGGYNEGLLIDEQVTGSAPLVEATAEIAVGPMAGERVPLINTEQSFLRPGLNSGDLQFDQMQRITAGASQFFTATGGLTNVVGAFDWSTVDTNTGGGGTLQRRVRLTFDSANSPDARTSSTTSGETRPKNRQATYYMRIA